MLERAAAIACVVRFQLDGGFSTLVGGWVQYRPSPSHSGCAPEYAMTCGSYGRTWVQDAAMGVGKRDDTYDVSTPVRVRRSRDAIPHGHRL